MPAKLFLLLAIMALASTVPASGYVIVHEPVQDVSVRNIIVCTTEANAAYVYEAATRLDDSGAIGVAHLLGCKTAFVMIDGPYVRRCEAARFPLCGQFPVALGKEVYFGVIFPHAVDAAAR